MSDFDDFEFNSSELGDVGSSNDKKDKPSTNSSDNKKEDDFKLPELPQAKQKNLSIINFSALKPPTGSSITISDGTNESLNVSRPPLLPARLTSIMSTPSQNQTSTEEEHKPKFDLPPLFGDLGGDDDDDEDEPNLGPINFPTDLDKKDQNDAIENKEKMDSITINSVSNNTSLFFNANRTIPDSPLKNNEFFDDENNNLNNSMKSNADQSLSQNNDLKPLDNFGDEIDAPHPLIPLRKAQSTSSFASQSPVKMNHSASKPSFLNINEIKNIKPGEPVDSNISEQKNNGLGSLNTINTTPDKSAMKVSSDNENQKENDINEDKNDKLNVMEIDDDDMNFSMGLSSDDEKQDQSKKNQNQNSPIKNAKTPPNTEKINSNPSSGQKNSQIHMTNNTQSTIPSQSKLAPSSLNDTEFNDNFFVDTEDQSKSQEPAESENEQSNQPIFPANPISNETFTSNVDGNDDDDDDDFAAFDQFVKDNKTSEVESDKSPKQVEPQKQTPQNSQVKITPKSTETKKIKTELGESAQKVKQSIKQAANKQQNRNQQIQQQQQQQQFQQQQQQLQQFQQQPKQQQQQQQQPQQLQQQPKQQQQQQVISPPIKNTTESPMVSGSQSPSPPNSSSESFHEREQINNNNKTQTMVNITKTEEQLSSVSLHLESDQPVKKRATKMAIEIGVENAFDSASAQFQRLFMNEFASMMRPTFQMPYDTDIDNFIDYLSKDINKELSSITKSYSPNSRKIRGISEKIEFLFDQGKDVLNEKLANSYENDLQRRASNYQKLRNLQSLVDDLNKTFSSKVTKSMKVIDNYLKDSQMVRSNKLMKAQVMQKNLRELTLERMHLEAKVNRQLNEFEEIDRRQNEVIMSYISFVTDSGLYDYGDDEKAVIMKKIARSITMISSDLDKVTYDGLIEMSNEGQCQINEERAKIRDEYTKIDGIAEKLKLLKQANESKKSSKKKDSKKKKA